MTPILTAIGMDATSSLGTARKYTILTEGITDYYYLRAMLDIVEPKLSKDVAVIPSLSCTKIPFLASVLIGWQKEFIILLDRDDAGDKSRQELIGKLDIDKEHIVQVSDALTIEDIIEKADFEKLLPEGAPAFEARQKASNYVSKHELLKVVCARKFAEKTHPLSAASIARIKKLATDLRKAMKA